MRTALDALLPRIRQRLLATTLLSPERWWFMAELARHLAVRASCLQRELPALVSAGILRERRDGRQVYYQADPDCPLLPDLRGLLLKTIGLADVLRRSLAPLGDRLDAAWVYGSVARGDATATSDVDLLVVGDVSLADLSSALGTAEASLAREINPLVYSRMEFRRKVAAGHHLLKGILSGPRIVIVGGERELAGPPGAAARAAPPDKSRRARRLAPSRRARSSRR